MNTSRRTSAEPTCRKITTQFSAATKLTNEANLSSKYTVFLFIKTLIEKLDVKSQGWMHKQRLYTSKINYT